MNSILHIAWITVRELLYERVFYILLSFAALSLGISLLLGQMTYTEHLKLTLDFMLGGIEISMILFSIFMGISLFHRELLSGSVSMVLSKPITRTQFLLGKFIGQIAVQMAVILTMTLVTVFIVSRFGGAVAWIAIAQAALFIFLEVCILTSITYFFAVNAGGITTAVAVLCAFAFGHLKPAIEKILGSKAQNNIAWQFTQGVIPNLDLFNLKALASYGISISPVEAGWVVLYALCSCLTFILLAILCFSRKDLMA